MKISVVGKGLLTLVEFCVLFSIITMFAFGQSGTSGVSGTITDQNGAAVPGATVTIINPETSFTRTATTSADGKYGFPGIPPATYRLEVTASNFKKLVNSNIRALVDTPQTVNMALEPGQVTAVVDVTANTIEGVINTQDASLGNNFEPRQITLHLAELRLQVLLGTQAKVAGKGVDTEIADEQGGKQIKTKGRENRSAPSMGDHGRKLARGR